MRKYDGPFEARSTTLARRIFDARTSPRECFAVEVPTASIREERPRPGRRISFDPVTIVCVLVVPLVKDLPINLVDAHGAL